MKIQLASYHCYNNLLHAWWLKTAHIYSLTSSLGQSQGVSRAVLPPEALGGEQFLCHLQLPELHPSIVVPSFIFKAHHSNLFYQSCHHITSYFVLKSPSASLL